MNSNYYPDYQFDRNQEMTWQQNNESFYPQDMQYANANDDRFFLAPFVVGGLAGTALGYGIANNNQINKGGCCMQPMFFYPQPNFQQQPFMYSSNSNNFYY